MSEAEVLFIGGQARSGRPPSRLSYLLGWVRAEFGTCLVEGDNLEPGLAGAHESSLALAEENLRAISRTYRRAGHARLIYTNTASVRGDVLTAPLRARWPPEGLCCLVDRRGPHRGGASHIERSVATCCGRSSRALRELQELAPPWVHRISTETRDVPQIAQIAQQIQEILGCVPLPEYL